MNRPRHLMLRHGKMGIWDLHGQRWHRKPFTMDREAALRELEKARNSSQTDVPEWFYKALAGTLGVLWCVYWMLQP